MFCRSPQAAAPLSIHCLSSKALQPVQWRPRRYRERAETQQDLFGSGARDQCAFPATDRRMARTIDRRMREAKESCRRRGGIWYPKDAQRRPKAGPREADGHAQRARALVGSSGWARWASSRLVGRLSDRRGVLAFPATVARRASLRVSFAGRAVVRRVRHARHALAQCSGAGKVLRGFISSYQFQLRSPASLPADHPRERTRQWV
jgi:hypothetical protein